MKDKSRKNANSSEIIWHLRNNQEQIFNTFQLYSADSCRWRC